MTIANNTGADCGDPLLSPLSYSGIYVDVKKEDNQGTSGIGKEHGLTPVHLTRTGWSKRFHQAWRREAHPNPYKPLVGMWPGGVKESQEGPRGSCRGSWSEATQGVWR